jgi:hypothetical protein
MLPELLNQIAGGQPIDKVSADDTRGCQAAIAAPGMTLFNTRGNSTSA